MDCVKQLVLPRRRIFSPPFHEIHIIAMMTDVIANFFSKKLVTPDDPEFSQFSRLD